MAPLEPIFEFTYHESATSLEPALGKTVEALERLALGCDLGSAYTRYQVQIRRKWRTISVPTDELDLVHRQINELLFPVDLSTVSAHGFVARRSTLTNASVHVGAAHLQQFDVENFFDSVTTERIKRDLASAGFGVEAATLLSRLVSCEGSLPLGARTSPRISNIVMTEFDEAMRQLAAANCLRYSRYADDLSFSADAEFDVSEEVASALSKVGLRINPAKSRRFKRGQPMFVTGLAVSDDRRPRLRKPFKRQLRTDFHYVNLYGASEHSSRTGRTEGRIMGQFFYARSVEPEFAARLAARYPKAHAELIPAPSHDRVARAARYRKEFVDAVRRADPVPLGFYVPTVAIGTV